MAFEEGLVNITMEAGQDLSGKLLRFITLASDGQVDPTTNGASADGVLQDIKAAVAGAACTVAISGTSKVVAGAAISVGDKVASDAAGKAKTAGLGDRVLGIARTAADADGNLIAVLLKLGGEPNA